MRLLIVDDEVDLSESLRRGLTNEGFVVDVANDGVTGACALRDVGGMVLVPAHAEGVPGVPASPRGHPEGFRAGGADR